MFAANAVAFFLQKPVCKTNNAHMITGSMFIKVSIKLVRIDGEDHEDPMLRNLNSEDAGYHDSLLNVEHVVSFYPSTEGNGTIVELLNGNNLNIKQSINEIHERINRAYSLPLLS